MTRVELRDALRSGLLADSNVLLLYLFGCFDLSLMPKAKPLAIYTKDDFYLLHGLVKTTGKVWCLPNIATEISNLSNKLPEWIQRKFLRFVGEHFETMTERYLPSSQVARWEYFPGFGLTDSAVAHFAQRERCLVVTNDAPLYSLLCSLGVTAVNFILLRSLR